MSPPDSLLVEGAIDYMVWLVSRTPKHGALVELGVYKGGSAWHLAQLARERGVPLHLFDTFEGIPERTEGVDSHKVGDFSDTVLEEVVRALQPVGAELHYHVGVFPHTMPSALPRLSFVHVDADQYATIKEAIRRFAPLLLRGGIMLFDDYGCLEGATKAVDEELGGELHATPQGKAYWIAP